MPHIISVRSQTPTIPSTCFIAETATVVGDVEMGSGCSLWFNVVVRGDVNRITIGENTNIQDGAVVHCTYQKHETRIGADVSVGHNAVVHGCRLHDRVLVGMGATVMDGAVVKSNVLIAAGALVPPGAELDPGYLYAGVPAKQIRLLTSEESEMIAQTALNYKMYAGWYRGG